MIDRLAVGAFVRTTKEGSSGGWTAGALASRRWGVEGQVVCHHDAHGLSYEVRHTADGTIGYYEHHELDPCVGRPCLQVAAAGKGIADTAPMPVGTTVADGDVAGPQVAAYVAAHPVPS